MRLKSEDYSIVRLELFNGLLIFMTVARRVASDLAQNREDLIRILTYAKSVMSDPTRARWIQDFWMDRDNSLYPLCKHGE